MSKFQEYEELAEKQWLEHEQKNKNCSPCQKSKTTNLTTNNPEIRKLIKTSQILDKYRKEILYYQTRIRNLLNVKNPCPFYHRYENFTLLWNTCNREEDQRTELIKKIEEIAKKSCIE